MFICLFFHSVTNTGRFFCLKLVQANEDQTMCFNVCLTDALCLSHTSLSPHKPYFTAGFVAILHRRHTE